MAEVVQYVTILLESLEKKKRLLELILEENKKQEEAVKAEGDMEAFDRTVKTKGKLVRELSSLDDGFEKVYGRIREALQADPDACREEIRQMQGLISQITELSACIEASEQRNKKLVEDYFSYTKGKIREAKKSMKVASDYYKNMSRTNYVDSQLMDRKK